MRLSAVATAAVLALAVCACSAPPAGRPPLTPSPRSVPPAAAVPGWRTLPDPGPTAPAAPGAPAVSTVADLGGTGGSALDLPQLPVGATHLVLRLVCAGPGAVAVLDGERRLLYGGSGCPESAAATGTPFTADLTDLAHRRWTGTTVAAGSTTSWRLSVGVY